MLEEPAADDLDRIAAQWIVAAELVGEHLGGTELDQSPDDLERIQALLDAGVLSAADTYELQCLGIALGRVLVRNIPGLDWAVIDDEYGRDPTIRLRKTSLQINVLTQISSRVERGAGFRVRDLYDSALEAVRRLADRVD